MLMVAELIGPLIEKSASFSAGASKALITRESADNPLARVFRTRTVESAFRDQTGLLCV